VQQRQAGRTRTPRRARAHTFSLDSWPPMDRLGLGVETARLQVDVLGEDDDEDDDEDAMELDRQAAAALDDSGSPVISTAGSDGSLLLPRGVPGASITSLIASVQLQPYEPASVLGQTQRQYSIGGGSHMHMRSSSVFPQTKGRTSAAPGSKKNRPRSTTEPNMGRAALTRVQTAPPGALVHPQLPPRPSSQHVGLVPQWNRGRI